MNRVNEMKILKGKHHITQQAPTKDILWKNKT
jgi:hypothetical protein